MAQLLDLPPELLLRISSLLTTPELGRFRQSCKQIEKALFKDFAREFFTKRQFMLEHVSLEALVGIANHPTLSTFLSEVIFGLQQLPHDPHFRSEESRRYREAGYMGRDLLLQTGLAHSMLVDAFSKLPNLKTVGLRDYDGAGRVRDGMSLAPRLGPCVLTQA